MSTRSGATAAAALRPRLDFSDDSTYCEDWEGVPDRLSHPLRMPSQIPIVPVIGSQPHRPQVEHNYTWEASRGIRFAHAPSAAASFSTNSPSLAATSHGAPGALDRATDGTSSPSTKPSAARGRRPGSLPITYRAQAGNLDLDKMLGLSDQAASNSPKPVTTVKSKVSSKQVQGNSNPRLPPRPSTNATKAASGSRSNQEVISSKATSAAYIDSRIPAAHVRPGAIAEEIHVSTTTEMGSPSSSAEVQSSFRTPNYFASTASPGDHVSGFPRRGPSAPAHYLSDLNSLTESDILERIQSIRSTVQSANERNERNGDDLITSAPAPGDDLSSSADESTPLILLSEPARPTALTLSRPQSPSLSVLGRANLREMRRKRSSQDKSSKVNESGSVSGETSLESTKRPLRVLQRKSLEEELNEYMEDLHSQWKSREAAISTWEAIFDDWNETSLADMRATLRESYAALKGLFHEYYRCQQQTLTQVHELVHHHASTAVRFSKWAKAYSESFLLDANGHSYLPPDLNAVVCRMADNAITIKENLRTLSTLNEAKAFLWEDIRERDHRDFLDLLVLAHMTRKVMMARRYTSYNFHQKSQIALTIPFLNLELSSRDLLNTGLDDRDPHVRTLNLLFDRQIGYAIQIRTIFEADSLENILLLRMLAAPLDQQEMLRQMTPFWHARKDSNAVFVRLNRLIDSLPSRSFLTMAKRYKAAREEFLDAIAELPKLVKIRIDRMKFSGELEANGPQLREFILQQLQLPDGTIRLSKRPRPQPGRRSTTVNEKRIDSQKARQSSDQMKSGREVKLRFVKTAKPDSARSVSDMRAQGRVGDDGNFESEHETQHLMTIPKKDVWGSTFNTSVLDTSAAGGKNNVQSTAAEPRRAHQGFRFSAGSNLPQSSRWGVYKPAPENDGGNAIVARPRGPVARSGVWRPNLSHGSTVPSTERIALMSRRRYSSSNLTHHMCQDGTRDIVEACSAVGCGSPCAPDTPKRNIMVSSTPMVHMSNVTDSKLEASTSSDGMERYTPEKEPETNADEEDASKDNSEDEQESSSEDHVPLDFQIPTESLKTAMTASKESGAAYWSHQLYKGPKGQPVSVHYCRNKVDSERVAQTFLGKSVVGFDLEWKPGAKDTDGIKQNVSLIQMASEERIGLFHVALFRGDTIDDLLPPTIKQICESPDIGKAGVNIRGDATRMKKFLDVECRGLVELTHWHKLVKHGSKAPYLVNKKLVALAAQVQEHLQLPLLKPPERTSDWSCVRPLNSQQAKYAAADAYAGVALYDRLESKRMKMKPLPPKPAFAELNLPILLANGKSTVEKKKKTKAAANTNSEDSKEREAQSAAPTVSAEGTSEATNAAEDAAEEPLEEVDEPQIFSSASDEDSEASSRASDADDPEITDDLSEESADAASDETLSDIESVASLGNVSDEESDILHDTAGSTQGAEQFFDAQEWISQSGDLTTTTPEEAGEQAHQHDSTDQPSTLATLSPPPLKPVTHPSLLAAETWLTRYLLTQPGHRPLPQSARPRSRSRNETAPASHQALRCYFLWHERDMAVAEIATLMRDPPLKPTTIANYVLEAVWQGKCPVSERMIEGGRWAEIVRLGRWGTGKGRARRGSMRK